MRRSFNGLHNAVANQLQEDPRSGSIFAFTNKRRSLLKILYWDGTGLWVLAKRLERGTFSWPKPSDVKTESCASTPPHWHFCWMALTCATVASARGMKSGRNYFSFL
jgi:hypothetical protein